MRGGRPGIVQPAGSPTRLGAVGFNEPLQSGPTAAVFAARMLLASVAVPERPPPLPLAELAEMVLLAITTLPPEIPPPAPGEQKARKHPPAATLPLIVLLLIVSVPASELAMPPPLPARLPLIVLLVMNRIQ